MPDNIYIIKSAEPGPTLVVMAGVHGNEQVGVKALAKIKDSLSIKAGTVYLIVANPQAIAENKRFIETNMNRCFGSANQGKTAEELRALEIQSVLDTADALLDIHAFNDLEGDPFMIADGAESIECAKIFNAPIVSTGWDAIHSGSSDWYMHQRGKIGVCLECGPISKQDSYIELAVDSIYRFLSHFDVIDYPFQTLSTQRTIAVARALKKNTADVAFSKDYSNFEKLPAGSVFLIDGEQKHVAGKDEVIIFPRPNGSIGSEVAIIGTESLS